MEIDNIHLTKINSTNTYAKQHKDNFDPEKLTCIIADQQTAGRGRFQRKWISPKGQNLTATFYFRLPVLTPHIEHLAQLMSYSVFKVLISYGFTPKFKFPNDILLQDRKVAGILCEIEQTKEHIHVFLGVGLNINMTQEHLAQIDQKATSLYIERKITFSIEEVYQKLQRQFMKDLKTFKEKGFISFSKELGLD